jgi:hypothetical protein
MCFSAEASFAAAAVLVPAGGYCIARAARHNLRYLPVALVPLAFAAQQFAEGFVWLGLRRDDADLVRDASRVYLFFALAFWPFMVPFSLCVRERRQKHRIILALFALLSLIWVWFYVPLALDPDRWLTTRVVHHSVQYDFDDLPAFNYLPLTLWRMIYLAFICAPLALALPKRSERGLLIPIVVVLLVGLFVLTYVLFSYAFTSVWCFFAAFLSLALCVVHHRLPSET